MGVLFSDDNGFFTIGDVTLQRGVYVAPIQSTGNIDAEAIPDNFVTFTIFVSESFFAAVL